MLVYVTVPENQDKDSEVKIQWEIGSIPDTFTRTATLGDYYSKRVVMIRFGLFCKKQVITNTVSIEKVNLYRPASILIETKLKFPCRI